MTADPILAAQFHRATRAAASHRLRLALGEAGWNARVAVYADDLRAVLDEDGVLAQARGADQDDEEDRCRPECSEGHTYVPGECASAVPPSPDLAEQDLCRPVTVNGDDGQPVTTRVRGAEPMSQEGQAAFGEIVRATQRKMRDDRRKEREARDADVRAVAALVEAVENLWKGEDGASEAAISARITVRVRFGERIAALDAQEPQQSAPDPALYFENGTCRLCGVPAGGNHMFECGNGGPEPRRASDGEGPIKRTAEYWCRKYGVEIRDPDGWRHPDAPAWDEPITLADFYARASKSTTNAVHVDWSRIAGDAMAGAR